MQISKKTVAEYHKSYPGPSSLDLGIGGNIATNAGGL